MFLTCLEEDWLSQHCCVAYVAVEGNSPLKWSALRGWGCSSCNSSECERLYKLCNRENSDISSSVPKGISSTSSDVMLVFEPRIVLFVFLSTCNHLWVTEWKSNYEEDKGKWMNKAACLYFKYCKTKRWWPCLVFHRCWYYNIEMVYSSMWYKVSFVRVRVQAGKL